MDSKEFCDSCGLEKMWYEDECYRCGGSKFSSEPTQQSVNPTKENIADHNNSNISMANSVVVSKETCFLCKNDHYMVYPVVRNPKEYNSYREITTLPFCPKRVWERSRIKIALSDLLEKCKVEGN